MSSGLDCNDNVPDAEKHPGSEDVLTNQDENPDWLRMVLDLRMLRDPGARRCIARSIPFSRGKSWCGRPGDRFRISPGSCWRPRCSSTGTSSSSPRSATPTWAEARITSCGTLPSSCSTWSSPRRRELCRRGGFLRSARADPQVYSARTGQIALDARCCLDASHRTPVRSKIPALFIEASGGWSFNSPPFGYTTHVRRRHMRP
jgi:hypothetical protein